MKATRPDADVTNKVTRYYLADFFGWTLDTVDEVMRNPLVVRELMGYIAGKMEAAKRK